MAASLPLELYTVDHKSSSQQCHLRVCHTQQMSCSGINISPTSFKHWLNDPFFHIWKHILQAWYVLFTEPWWLLLLLLLQLTCRYWLSRPISSRVNNLSARDNWLRYHHNWHVRIHHGLGRCSRYFLKWVEDQTLDKHLFKKIQAKHYTSYKSTLTLGTVTKIPPVSNKHKTNY